MSAGGRIPRKAELRAMMADRGDELTRKPILTVAEYSAVFDCSPVSTYRAIESGKLKALRIGNAIRLRNPLLEGA
jgi:hypothetical protein